MSTVRLAIIGVGNCAAALVQGLEYYATVDPSEEIPGVMHAGLDGYEIADIEPVAAFDVDSRKVGTDLVEAITASPNCVDPIGEIVPETGVMVQRGPVLDGVAEHTQAHEESKRVLVDEQHDPVDVAATLADRDVDVVVNYLPVGSEKATEFYAEAAISAGCAFVNCIPVFIASDETWASRFEAAGLPVVGDDIKSQLGATIVHRALAKLADDRGVALDHTYQLNVGGNTDFLNMLDRSRLASKKTSKTEAVQSQLSTPLADDDIHIGPSDYVPWQKDTKVCYLRMEGRTFGDQPVDIELRLNVEDSANSAGVAIDAIRGAKVAMDRELSGPITAVSSYLMKHPPIQYPDDEARDRVESFIAGE